MLAIFRSVLKSPLRRFRRQVFESPSDCLKLGTKRAKILWCPLAIAIGVLYQRWVICGAKLGSDDVAEAPKIVVMTEDPAIDFLVPVKNGEMKTHF